MKKLGIFAVLLCIFAFFVPCNTAFAQTTATYVVSANVANVYEKPSFSSQVTSSLKCNDTVQIYMDGNKAKQFFNDGFMFYQTQNGYIFADLVVPQNAQIVSVPNYNAQTNSDCKVYLKQNNQMVESDITLQKGTRLFLYEGFNSKTEFTAVAFMKDNQVIYGYISTKAINPDGINPTIIVCVTVILAVLGIIFAWLFIRHKKSKKMLA